MTTEIIVIHKGKDYNITNTALISDYLEKKYIPELDKLLDWRLKLKEIGKRNEYPKKWVLKEILATDYLLDELNKK
jgi:hypothetical protein